MINDGARFHRKKTFHTALTVFFALVILGLAALLALNWRSRLGNERKDLRELWESGDYERTFALSGEKLAAEPMDYFLLVLHGFSSYQLAVAQVNSFDTLAYIDGCIWALRKALLTREGLADGRVYYVLGKAYYYKGPGYADLSAAYLEKARSLSFAARDIPEYLGLSYASLRDYRASVAAFTLALYPEGEGGGGEDTVSDILLLAIARSYAELEDPDPARAYLLRCVENSRDFDTVVAARLLLGEILARTGDSTGAEDQYLAIADEGSGNAEAHYRLGELYAQRGDSIRARAEWRKAVRIDPAHGAARIRLNL